MVQEIKRMNAAIKKYWEMACCFGSQDREKKSKTAYFWYWSTV